MFSNVAAPKIRSGLITGQLPAHTRSRLKQLENWNLGRTSAAADTVRKRGWLGGLHVPTRVPGVHVSLQGQLNAETNTLLRMFSTLSATRAKPATRLCLFMYDSLCSAHSRVVQTLLSNSNCQPGIPAACRVARVSLLDVLEGAKTVLHTQSPMLGRGRK